MLAAQRGHKDITKSLLEKNADPNVTDKVGLCLHVWIMYRYCSLRAQTAGRSALFFATEEGNIKIAKLLISGGADVDMKDKVTVRAAAACDHTDSSLLPNDLFLYHRMTLLH